MTEKDLIVKLNNLKNVNPDSQWLESNRDLLLTQISNAGTVKLSVWKTFFINLNSFAKTAAKPAYALVTLFMILVVGSLFANTVFGGAKPNDTLYIARLISEKAKLGTIFNTQQRDKLAAQFATERAQDISAVLADPEINNNNNQAQIAQLSASFNNEINTVKDHLSRLSSENAGASKSQVSQATNTKIKADQTATGSDGSVSIAGDGKNVNALQIFKDPNLKANWTATSTATSSASSTTATDTVTIDGVKTGTSSATQKILDDAQKLFDQKSYQEALDKLKEVDQLINKN